jgi:hypothetical protein
MFDRSTISVNLRCESICTLEDRDKDGHGQVNNKIRKSLILLIATSVEERVFSKNQNVISYRPMYLNTQQPNVPDSLLKFC